MKNTEESTGLTPDRRPVTQMQARRLSSLTGVKVEEIAGRSVAELTEKLKWRIDPELLFFRRICGRVVKKDPATGVEYPVPFATVHVEDTDCSFLGFFPAKSPWSWFFPFHCRREEIATVETDACGRFCVFVPRWEVDWILRFRRLRICLPDIFIKPTIRDLLEGLQRPPVIRRPFPDPDPPPPILKDGGLTLRRVEDLLGREVAGKLAAFEAGAGFGADAARQLHLLAASGVSHPLPPPLPKEFKKILEETAQAQGVAATATIQTKTIESAHEALAARLNLDIQTLEKIDFRRFIGPFRRCLDMFVPEWVPVIDIPDITFRVTQDVDGDGSEETIYAEGFFDVRWNAGPIPDVTLHASQIAVAGVTCDTPVDVPCGTTPAITFVGLMPVINPPGPADPYHDAATGYARRPNRPHPSGDMIDPMPNPLAASPYSRTLQLYGCNHGVGAVYYRLLYRFNGGARVPFTGLSWPLHRLVGGMLQTIWPTADADGWYPILPDADGWFPPHLLLNWPTTSFQDGLYTVELQLGNAAKAPLSTSAQVGFRIDNSLPVGPFFTELHWRVAGGAWRPVSLICPVIHRPVIGGIPADIEIQVSYHASAAHLRSAVLYAGGCGGGNPTLISPLNTAQHWHTGPLDNSVTNTASFAVPGVLQQGAYSFTLVAATRAFNPAGGDGGYEADWNYDPIYNYVTPYLPIAIVNG